MSSCTLLRSSLYPSISFLLIHVSFLFCPRTQKKKKKHTRKEGVMRDTIRLPRHILFVSSLRWPTDTGTQVVFDDISDLLRITCKKGEACWGWGMLCMRIYCFNCVASIIRLKATFIEYEARSHDGGGVAQYPFVFQCIATLESSLPTLI